MESFGNKYPKDKPKPLFVYCLINSKQAKCNRNALFYSRKRKCKNQTDKQKHRHQKIRRILMDKPNIYSVGDNGKNHQVSIGT